MELESGDGSKTPLVPGSTTHFGRGAGFYSGGGDDRTVSRRQILFHPCPSSSEHYRDGARVRFEVVGKNPVWVQTSKSGGVKAYRSSERGEMEIGDSFCVSAKNPVWFTLKKTDFEAEGEKDRKIDPLVESELAESLGSSHGRLGFAELELDSINLSDIDPVKEFGLVVMGHEFDGYPKDMIHDIKNWDWDLEESRDDEGRRGRKRRKSDKSEDDEWRVESDEKEEMAKSRRAEMPKYMTTTRSKGTGKEKFSGQRKSTRA
ncbi:unnamed protein product [Cuscuta campestris]|uniref:Uncharacterized protein n=1 Tax=Cuscuta campestris TaxID=132261 RepID=A0A484KMS9_9ASTE|nr:unnamed protein product [Cuscuta campestris]